MHIDSDFRLSFNLRGIVLLDHVPGYGLVRGAFYAGNTQTDIAQRCYE